MSLCSNHVENKPLFGLEEDGDEYEINEMDDIESGTLAKLEATFGKGTNWPKK